MLYHPDDPLITWLRDGHLGGVTLGSTREEVLEKWGEPPGEGIDPRHPYQLLYGNIRNPVQASLTVIFESQTVAFLYFRIEPFLPPRLPESLALPPYLLDGRTTFIQFADLMNEHQIRIHPIHRPHYTSDAWRFFESELQLEIRFKREFFRGIVMAAGKRNRWWN